MRLIKRVFSSAAMLIGVLVVIGTFIGILFFLQSQQPPTHRVLVAAQDIPAYTTLTADLVAVDEQMIHPSLLAGLVLEEQFAEVEGAVTLAPIYAGEQVSRARLATGAQGDALRGLSQALNGSDLVAMVLPVDATSAPGRIRPGDHVNLVFSLGAGGSALLNGDLRVTLTNPAAALPAQDPDSVVLSATLPASMVLLRDILVLDAEFELVQNPEYTGGGLFGGEGEEASTQPAYIQGDIRSLTLLLDREQQAVLAFGMHNGRIDVAVAPGFAPDEEQPGVSWTDLNWWYFTRQWGQMGPAPWTTEPATATVPVPAVTPEPPEPTAAPSPTATP
ncbi:MAG: hypothetical protein KKA73_13910 [Chloroflexi bacterium]|nr:hypothetical protein [Chloroflexota bacterium]MBU1748779.1 hypothetical protein [Chloroflexota bacterium]